MENKYEGNVLVHVMLGLWSTWFG